MIDIPQMAQKVTIDGGITYIALAPPGTALSKPAWQCKKISESIQVDIITLTGTSGTATITLAGGLTKTVTFNSDLHTTAIDFVNSFYADYIAQGIIISVVNDAILFTTTVPGVTFTHPAIANASGDLTGTINNTTDAVIAWAGGTLEFKWIALDLTTLLYS